MSVFHRLLLNKRDDLRAGWWIAIFVLLLASVVAPAYALAERYRYQVTEPGLALMIVAVTVICQLLRRAPLAEVFGRPDAAWLKQLGIGLGAGGLLVAVPALVLTFLGSLHWQPTYTDPVPLIMGLGTLVAIAVAEEVLFRGFVFQRLVDGVGVWPAQVAVAGLFLLTHLNNPGMAGPSEIWAAVNIVLTSMLFGLAYLRTRSLAMSIGLHFMTNLVMGPIPGLGVNGHQEVGVFWPTYSAAPSWLTGGDPGLASNAPGMICVVLVMIMLFLTPDAEPRGTVLRTG